MVTENELAKRVQAAQFCCVDCGKLYGRRLPTEAEWQGITGADLPCEICGNDEEGSIPARDFGGLAFARAAWKGEKV